MRIAIECLTCRHCGSIPEQRLEAFGLSRRAPIVTFIKRLVCEECGGHSVRAYRYESEPA